MKFVLGEASLLEVRWREGSPAKDKAYLHWLSGVRAEASGDEAKAMQHYYTASRSSTRTNAREIPRIWYWRKINERIAEKRAPKPEANR